jgi:hypothetical protein
MKKIVCLAFVLFTSIGVFAQEKTADKSELDKVRSSSTVKAEGELSQTLITNKKSDEITEVSFERKGCHGPCPIDKVIFRRNGSHSYNGIKYVDRIGNYQADLQELKIGALVRVLERVNYRNLKDNYVMGSDMQIVVLNVTRQGSSKTIMASSSEDMPVEMVIIQAFIENVMSSGIRWKKVE